MRRRTNLVEISLSFLRAYPAYREDDTRQSLLKQIQSLPSSTIKSNGSIKGWPTLPMEELLKEKLWEAFTPLVEEISIRIQPSMQDL